MPVALGERVATRAQHLHPVAQPPQERVEERERVDEVVRVGQTDDESGGAGLGARRAGVHACVAGRSRSGALLLQQGRQQRFSLAVRVGGIPGQLVSGRRDVVVLGALPAAHDLGGGPSQVDLGELQMAAVEAVAVSALELAAAGDARLEHAGEVERGESRGPLAVAVRGRPTRERPCGEQRDADGAHRTRVGRDHDLALEHRRERPGQSRVAGGLALEEHAVQQPSLTHHPAAVVAHHRVLQTGEDVLAAEAVTESLGRHVGDEHRARLAEVGGPLAARGQPPELHDVVHAVGDRLLLEERAGAGAAHTVHVGVDHAAVLDVDELGVLAADLDDGEAAAAVRVQTGGRRRVRDDLVLHDEPLPEAGERGAEDRGRGVASGACEPDRDDGVRRHLAGLGHQRLGSLNGIALGAPVDTRQHSARAGVDQRGL